MRFQSKTPKGESNHSKPGRGTTDRGLFDGGGDQKGLTATGLRTDKSQQKKTQFEEEKDRG